MNAADKVIDNLKRCSWKLLGIAGLCKREGEDGQLLDRDEIDGLYWILKEIAEDISDYADLITEAKQQS